jgi:hypothetical protein
MNSILTHKNFFSHYKKIFRRFGQIYVLELGALGDCYSIIDGKVRWRNIIQYILCADAAVMGKIE